MKKKVNYTCYCFILLFVALLVGCHDTDLKKDQKRPQPDLTNEEIKRLVLLDASYVYPIEQAKVNALTLAAQFLEKKDGIKRSIEQVITVPSLYTIDGKTSIKTDFAISKPKTPSLYIANFSGNNGYVILSADKRATQIIATVGSGTIDSLMHPGLRVFLSNAVMHIDEKVAEMEALRGDDAFKSMVDKLNLSRSVKEKPTIPVYVPNAKTADDILPDDGQECHYISTAIPIQTVNTTTLIAQPLLTTLWHQRPPYNNGQPDGGCSAVGCGGATNNKYLAGCVPIAEGQVVAYFRNNTQWQSITGKTCSTYSTEETDAVANLVHSIYLDYGIYVSRACGSTGAGFQIGDLQFTSPRGISPKYGLVKGEWRDWNTGHIRNSLTNGSPVVIQGTLHLCCLVWCWGCGGGHEWVIDGMRDLGVQTTYRVTSYYEGSNCGESSFSTYTYTTTTTTNTQIHQNWGWGVNTGSDPNDWYAQDVFESNAGFSDDVNFNHANYIVPYITPN